METTVETRDARIAALIAEQEGSTTAQRVAALFDDDGQVHRYDPDGLDVTLDEACEAVRHDRLPIRDWVKWRFEDGSALVAAHYGWDLALDPAADDCACWAGVRDHNSVCPLAD